MLIVTIDNQYLMMLILCFLFLYLIIIKKYKIKLGSDIMEITALILVLGIAFVVYLFTFHLLPWIALVPIFGAGILMIPFLRIVRKKK
jgi:hypothetical protein